MIVTRVYRRSRAYYLSEIAHFRRWVRLSARSQEVIIDSTSHWSAPQLSDRECQTRLAQLRQQYWSASNREAREADTHQMTGCAHLTFTPGRVTLTWQWFTTGGERRSKTFTAPDDGDRRELERIEFEERPTPRARGFKCWASRDWKPVEVLY